MLTLREREQLTRRAALQLTAVRNMAKPQPNRYPVAARFPGRIAAALLAAFSLAAMAAPETWSTSLCDCKAREFLAMLPFAYNDAGAATPDVFEQVSLK